MTRLSILWKATRNWMSEACGMSYPNGALRATGVRHIYLIVCGLVKFVPAVAYHQIVWVGLRAGPLPTNVMYSYFYEH